MSLIIKNKLNLVAKGVRTNGLRKTVGTILSHFRDYSFDIKYGTDTMRWEKLNNLEINSENKCRGVDYQPTPARSFRRLINNLDIPNDNVFVDVGCGKGRVLLMASDYGFKRIVGVEFSHELCQVARRNVYIYRNKFKLHADITIIESDIIDYEIKDDESIFYLYRPFEQAIMTNFLDNIILSLEKKSRKVWLIYLTPIYHNYHNIIDGHKNFLFYRRYEFLDAKFTVYVNDS